MTGLLSPDTTTLPGVLAVLLLHCCYRSRETPLSCCALRSFPVTQSLAIKNRYIAGHFMHAKLASICSPLLGHPSNKFLSKLGCKVLQDHILF